MSGARENKSAKRSAVRPTVEDLKVVADVPAAVEAAEKQAEGNPQQRELKLRGDVAGWALVPKPFLGLMAFCVGFALLSLVMLLAMATARDRKSASAHGDHISTNDGASSSILLGIGVLSSIVGSLQTASGYCAQRLSHEITAVLRRRERTKSPTSTRKHHPLFHIGLLLLVCGTISAIVNLGILGQSVTAPFAAMTLVFNGCLAFTVLHEAVTKYDVVATVLVLLGVGVAMVGVGMAQLDARTFTLADMETIFTRSAFPALYSVCMLGSLAASYVIIKKRRWQKTSAGLCCFSIGAGVLSGFSSLCVKCTVEVLKSVTQQHSSDLSNPVLYVFVAGIPVCVLSQLKLMTLGLEHFGTLKFVPPYHAFIILSNLINGMVYFDEASGYDALSAVLFIAGCAVTIGGVFVLLAKVPTIPAADAVPKPTVVIVDRPSRAEELSANKSTSDTSGENDLELAPNESREALETDLIV